MSAAPKLADIIAAKPHVFDGMLDPALISELPTRTYLEARLSTFVGSALFFEEKLDRLRIFAFEQRFLIGIRLLTGAIGGRAAAHAFTDLADLVIAEALKAVELEMHTVHGRVSGGRVAIVGLGKLGSRELTAGSDVDLILLYDHDEGAGDSDGSKPIDPNRYFTRLTQRMIAALSAPTSEGVLYEVDMRLRPSGNKGPVATRIRAFEKYQHKEGWTWEHMALSRARLVAGDDSLIREAETIIDGIVTLPRDRRKIAADIREMRDLIENEKPARDHWDVKLMAGGLVDIEFIAQYLALMAASDGIACEGRDPGTEETLRRFGPDVLKADALETVVAALRLYSDIAQMVRLCIDGPLEPKEAPAGLRELLCRAGEVPDFKLLEAEVKRRAQAVRKIFRSVLAT